MQRNTPEGTRVLIWTGATMLDGKLVTPAAGKPPAVLIASTGATAHHAGYLRMASRFASEGHAVLIADLLNPDEQQIDSRTGHYRADVPLLAERLRAVVNWLQHETRDAGVALFGSGVVAAAALRVAAGHAGALSSLILAGPRLDLVDTSPESIHAPVLLLVSETDPPLMERARRWQRSAGVQMVVIAHDSSSIYDDDNAVTCMIDHAAEWVHTHEREGVTFA